MKGETVSFPNIFKASKLLGRKWTIEFSKGAPYINHYHTYCTTWTLRSTLIKTPVK